MSTNSRSIGRTMRTNGIAGARRKSSVANPTRHHPRSRTGDGAGSDATSFIVSSLCLRPAGVRQQCEIARLLDGLGELALVDGHPRR